MDTDAMNQDDQSTVAAPVLVYVHQEDHGDDDDDDDDESDMDSGTREFHFERFRETDDRENDVVLQVDMELLGNPGPMGHRFLLNVDSVNTARYEKGLFLSAWQIQSIAHRAGTMDFTPETARLFHLYEEYDAYYIVPPGRDKHDLAAVFSVENGLSLSPATADQKYCFLYMLVHDWVFKRNATHGATPYRAGRGNDKIRRASKRANAAMWNVTRIFQDQLYRWQGLESPRANGRHRMATPKLHNVLQALLHMLDINSIRRHGNLASLSKLVFIAVERAAWYETEVRIRSKEHYLARERLRPWESDEDRVARLEGLRSTARCLARVGAYARLRYVTDPFVAPLAVRNTSAAGA